MARRFLLTTTFLVFAAQHACAQRVVAPSVTPDAPAALDDFARRDPAIASALDLPRETPSQQMRVVTVLIDLGHPEVASLVMPDLAKAKLDEAGRAALVREFGTARFMEIIRLKIAEGEQFAQSCLAAAAAEARDPTHIAALVKQLTTGSEEEQVAARTDLKSSGEAAIGPCLEALAIAKDAEPRAELMAALIDLQPASEQPVVAVLADGAGQVRAAAAELAGYMRLRDAVPQLAALAVTAAGDPSAPTAAVQALARLGMTAPAPAEAQALIRRRLAELGESSSLPTAEAENVNQTWWTWDAASQKLRRDELSPRQIRAIKFARLSRALAAAGGLADPAARTTAIMYGWEEASLTGREPADSLKQLVAATPPAAISRVLQESMESENLGAAVLAVRELSQRGDPGVLITVDGQPSPLAAALVHPGRDLRFAALEAVMKLAPSRSFSGSSYVADALWFFAVGAGDPAAVVASPVFTRASGWAGDLRGLGYDATPTSTGRDALVAALAPEVASRLTIIVIDAEISDPPLREIVYQLRASDRTARTPIVVCAAADAFESPQRIADSDRRLTVVPRPHSSAALKAAVDEGLALVGGPRSPELRQKQAIQSLTWIANLLATGSPYDELIREGALVHQALWSKESSSAAISVLAVLGTSDSQQALADYASSLTEPIAARETAAAAFERSVRRFGVQLTRSQVIAQYDRYNASEHADAATQKVLGRVLDAIEGKKK